MHKITFFLLFFSLLSLLFALDSQTEETMSIDWSIPETLNPFQENIGDFLDIDLYTILRQASNAYYARKYDDAAKYYLTYLRYNIDDAVSIYNLACCYALLGKDTLAVKYLRRALRAGFNDIYFIKTEPDFYSLRTKKIFANALDSTAAELKQLGSIMLIEAPALYKCRIQIPDNYNSEKAYTLLVGLHGRGDTPDRFITQWQKFIQPEFIFVAPRAPYEMPHGERNNYRWRITEAGEGYLTQSMYISENYITEVVKTLSRRYNIGDVYLLGFSQGGFFTYNTGIKNHHLFKGLICFGTWIDTTWLATKTIKEGNSLNVFIAHGTNDQEVPHRAGERAKEMLEEHNYDVTFRTFDGGHTIPEDVLREAVEWMLKR